MTNIVAHASHQSGSPFDSIRRFKDGQEYWSARELMPVLGYQDWVKFKAVVENAQENIESLGLSVLSNFFAVEVNNSDASGKKRRGRPSIDFLLSRLACYHVALSCDSRGNPQVKAAKHYFAVKTREAETVVPALSEELEVMRLKLQVLEAEKALLDKKEWITTALPEHQQQKILGYQVVEKVRVEERVYRDEQFIRDNSTMTKTELCERLGIKTPKGKPDYARLKRFLETADIPSEAWHLKVSLVDNYELDRSFFDVIARAWDDQRGQRFLGE